jgi:hypothetical protein
MERKFHYIYKTTCSLTKCYYFGMHSTDNLDDGYIGSGTNINKSFKKYGRKNHIKEILGFYTDRESLAKAEYELISESILSDPLCMNIAKGGNSGSLGSVSVKDSSGNTLSVSIYDSRYLSGKLVPITMGIVQVKDSSGNFYSISKDDPKYLSGELVGITKGTLSAKTKDGKSLGNISLDDPRYLSGEAISANSGLIYVKDKTGKRFSTDKNDPRYLSGELVGMNKGISISKEHKRKIAESNSLKQKGKNNSQFGTCWINNGKKDKKIRKNDPIPKGWIKGRVKKS